MDEWIHIEWALVAKSLGDGCQLAMKLLIDVSGNPSQIGKGCKHLELIRFVGKKPNIRMDFFPLRAFGIISCIMIH